MKIAIIGFGKEGQSLVHYLRKHPKYKKAELWVLDKNPDSRIPRGVKTVLGPGYLSNLERFDIILRSPGIPYRLGQITRAREAGKKVSSATKLFFEEIRKKGVKVIGVTGSKGKTTTATLIYLMLKAAKFRVFLGGNIGTSPLDLLPKLKKGAPSKRGASWVVLELSSFQLQDLETSPDIAVILDVFPEHLDVHKNLAEYYEAKGNICRYQGPKETTFYLSHNPITRWLSESCPGKRVAIHEKDPAFFQPEELKLRGVHFFRNALAAARVAEALGVKPEIIRRVVTSFPGLPHRLELVRTIPAKKGGRAIEFYNDSAAHNPNAAAAGLASFPKSPKILIGGGKDRPFDYTILRNAIQKHRAEEIILFGENKLKIKAAVEGAGISVRLVSTLREAVQTAYREAKKAAQEAGEPVVVLLSPGAPSYDMFQNFEDRGREFVRLVKALPK